MHIYANRHTQTYGRSRAYTYYSYTNANTKNSTYINITKYILTRTHILLKHTHANISLKLTDATHTNILFDISTGAKIKEKHANIRPFTHDIYILT